MVALALLIQPTQVRIMAPEIFFLREEISDAALLLYSALPREVDCAKRDRRHLVVGGKLLRKIQTKLTLV